MRGPSKNAPSVDKQLFSAESVAIAVANLDPGKASCFDGLQSEHLTYCHPCHELYSCVLVQCTLVLFHLVVDCRFGVLLMGASLSDQSEGW